MKIAAWVLAVLLAGVAVVAGLQFSRATKAEQELRELGGKYDDLVKANNALNTSLDATQSRLADATKQLESTRSELSNARSDGKRESEAKAALAELLNRKAQLDKLLRRDLVDAGSRVSAAEQTLISSPTQDGFSALKQSYAAFRSTLAKADPLLKDLLSFIEANRDRLQSNAEVVSEAESGIRNWKSGYPDLVRKLDEIESSATKAKLGVMSTQGWQATDLDVEPKDVVCASASGIWLYAPFFKRRVDANGDELDDKYKIFTDLPNGALLVRIHGEETARLATVPFAAPRSGKIEYRINDSKLDDNEGTIDVTVWKFKPFSAE